MSKKIKPLLDSKCIFILGMHRSGTSAFAGALETVGFDLGDNLLPSNAFNEKGYFEDRDFYQLNDKILASYGRKWDSLTPFALNPRDLFKEKIQSLFIEKFSKSNNCVIKDPRISLLFPLWKSSLEEIGVKCYAVIAYRDPREVAESLKRRDRTSILKSILLWLNYTLEAELSTRGSVQRMFVHYDDFLRHPVKHIQQLIEICKSEIKLDKDILSQVSHFIDPSLKHHIQESSTGGELDQFNWIIELYERLMQGNVEDVFFDSSLQKLKNALNLYYSKDITQTLSNDLNSTKSSLYINTGYGYEENQKRQVNLDYLSGEFVIEFSSLKTFKNICSLRWDPLEDVFIRIIINSIQIINRQDQIIEIHTDKLKSNGLFLGNGEIEFHTSDPWIEFQIEEDLKEVKIIARIWQLDTRNTFRVLNDQLAKSKKESARLENLRAKLEAEKNTWFSETKNQIDENRKLLLEKSNWLDKLGESKNELSKANIELSKSNHELSNAKQELANTKNELSEVQVLLLDSNSKLSEAAKHNKDLRYDLGKFKEAFEEQKRRSKHYRVQSIEVKRKLADLKYYKHIFDQMPSSVHKRSVKAVLYRLDRFLNVETPIPKSYLLNKLIFNEDYYLKENAGLNEMLNGDTKLAAEHWANIGIYQGLAASVTFDVRYYLESNKDLKKHFKKDYKKAIKHWLEYGIDEGRPGSKEFNVIIYSSNYPDVKKAFGNDFRKITNHWVEYGIKEARIGNSNLDGTKSKVLDEVQTVAMDGVNQTLITENSARTDNFPVIIYESHNLNLQGAPNSLFEIASGIKKKRKLRPIVMSSSDGPLSVMYDKARIPFVAHATSQRRLNASEGAEKVIKSLAKIYRKSEAKLLHANTLQNFHTILAAHEAGIPSVWNIRESEDPATYFDYLSPELKKIAYSSFEKASVVVFVAEATRKIWLPLIEDKVYSKTITNGVNFDRLHNLTYGTSRAQVRKSLGFNESDMVIYNVGTVSSRKGQKDIVDALKRLEPLELRSIIVAIAGFNDTDYSLEVKEELFELEEKGLRTIFIRESSSEKERRKVAELYLASDIFILSSRIESYPRVILEAMEFGLSIISTPCFGVKEQLVEGSSVLYYEEGNGLELKERILQYLNNPIERKNFGRAAKNQLAKLNSYHDMLNLYQDLYDKVLNEEINA